MTKSWFLAFLFFPLNLFKGIFYDLPSLFITHLVPLLVTIKYVAPIQWKMEIPVFPWKKREIPSHSIFLTSDWRLKFLGQEWLNSISKNHVGWKWLVPKHCSWLLWLPPFEDDIFSVPLPKVLSTLSGPRHVPWAFIQLVSCGVWPVIA